MLIYPIGLISADEVAFAGGVFNSSNSSYYLYNSAAYWTMSPYNFNFYAYMFFVRSIGDLKNYDTNVTIGIRPFINIRADVALTGSGTVLDPFKVVGAD